MGQVAEGVLFSTGKAVLGWTTKHKSVAVYDSIDELVAIHGHEGMTGGKEIKVNENTVLDMIKCGRLVRKVPE